MEFISEYLVYETFKQFIEIKKNLSFFPYERSKTWEGTQRPIISLTI
jgi:hypothetical protein